MNQVDPKGLLHSLRFDRVDRYTYSSTYSWDTFVWKATTDRGGIDVELFQYKGDIAWNSNILNGWGSNIAPGQDPTQNCHGYALANGFGKGASGYYAKDPANPSYLSKATATGRWWIDTGAAYSIIHDEWDPTSTPKVGDITVWENYHIPEHSAVITGISAGTTYVYGKQGLEGMLASTESAQWSTGIGAHYTKPPTASHE